MWEVTMLRILMTCEKNCVCVLQLVEKGIQSDTGVISCKVEKGTGTGVIHLFHNQIPLDINYNI